LSSGKVQISVEGFRAELASGSDPIRVELSGNAESDSKPHLDQFFEAVHQQAVSAKCRSIDVDLMALQFMSSSCFKSFVTWLALVQKLAPEARYHIDFTSNPKIRWQRASLSALSCFAINTVRIRA
jgi:hypothetical protein